MTPRIIVVAGPTASGKTALGIQLAKKFRGAIISADSRMVYRGLDVGTGKPTWEHRQLDRAPWIESKPSEFGSVYSIEGIDHYGLDLVDTPRSSGVILDRIADDSSAMQDRESSSSDQRSSSSPRIADSSTGSPMSDSLASGDRSGSRMTRQGQFTLTDWLAFVRPLIAHLQRRRIQPIVVGGTGLYLRALVHGFEPPPTDAALRARIEARTDDELLDALYEHDPVTAQRSTGNRRRLVRALEVVELTGRPISDPIDAAPLAAIVLAPQVERVELYARIDRRLQERFEAGLIDEVSTLMSAGVSIEWLRSLGLEYRFVTDWLTQFPLNQFHLTSGMKEVEILEDRLSGASHRYARRQLTYLRHQLPVHWVAGLDDALTTIQAA